MATPTPTASSAPTLTAAHTPTPHVRRRHHRLLALLLLPVVGLLAAACGSTAAPTATPTTVAPANTTPIPPPAHAVVTTQTVAGLGKILVNTQGQVLYTFTKNGAAVPCSSSCLAVWPAVTLPTGVTTPTGAAGVGTLATTTANGPTQVTVGGLPLFTYAGDSAPGVANGNNLQSFGGTWKVVKAQ